MIILLCSCLLLYAQAATFLYNEVSSNRPSGVAMDAQGNAYVCTVTGPPYLYKYVTSTKSLTAVTSGITCAPWGIALHPISGLVYTHCRGTALYQTNPSTGATGVSYTGTWGQLGGLIFDPTGDNLYIASVAENKVYKLTIPGLVLTTVTTAVFSGAYVGGAVFVDSTDIYVGSAPSPFKIKLSDASSSTTPPKTTLATSTTFGIICGIAADAQGNVFVSDVSGAQAGVTLIDTTGATKLIYSNNPAGGSLSVSPDGRTVVVATYDPSVLVQLDISTPALAMSAGVLSTTKFLYTGAEQTYVVPAGVTQVQIDACGGAGGARGGTCGGKGGYVQALLPVTPGATLYIEVGAYGIDANRIGGTSMFNGGGYSSWGNNNGGGGSDARTATGGSLGLTNLGTRLVVAGGGGGSANCPNGGGAGGGLIGGQGSGSGGAGGTQTAAGARVVSVDNNGGVGGTSGFGVGDSAGSTGGGGGGGWYGGGAGTGNVGAGGGSSYVVPTGTILANVQGDSRCYGDGAIYVSTLPPTPGPTASPTRRFRESPSADFLWSSLHNGPLCNSSAVGFSVQAWNLEQCTPSIDAASSYHPYVLRCFEGPKSVSVIKDTYADFACSQAADPRKGQGKGGVVYHAKTCSAQEAGLPGQSARTRCDTMSAAVAVREMVVLQSFTRAGCVEGMKHDGADPRVLGIFLNACAYVGGVGALAYHRKLTYLSGDGSSSDLVLQERRYMKTDRRCTGAVQADSRIVVTAVTSAASASVCLPDPLHPGRFYSQVYRTLDYHAAANARAWAPQPVWPTTSP